jgi:hypothetical protein
MFGLVNRFIDHLRVGTENNYYTIADFHTTNHATVSLISLYSLVFTCYNSSLQWLLLCSVFNGRFLVPNLSFRCPLVSTQRLNPQLTRSTESVRVRVTLRLTVSQSVSLGVEPRLGPMTRYELLFDSYCLVLGRAPSLTRGRVCHLSVSQSIVSMYNFYILHVLDVIEYIYNIYKTSVSAGSIQQIVPCFW